MEQMKKSPSSNVLRRKNRDIETCPYLPDKTARLNDEESDDIKPKQIKRTASVAAINDDYYLLYESTSKQHLSDQEFFERPLPVTNNPSPKKKCRNRSPPPPPKRAYLEKTTCRFDSSYSKTSKKEDSFKYENILDYAVDVFVWKKSLESTYFVSDCLKSQKEVLPDMRCTVLKWLVAVSRQFDFDLETWCLAVNILDRFFSAQPLKKDCLQLAGLTAFFLAAKQEEVDPPEISELVTLCANSFDRKQFRYMEIIILNRLKFKLVAPTASYFLVHLIEIERLGPFWPGWISRHLIEKVLCDYFLSQYLPSEVAQAIFEVLMPTAKSIAKGVTNESELSLEGDDVSADQRTELVKQFFNQTKETLLQIRNISA